MNLIIGESTHKLCRGCCKVLNKSQHFYRGGTKSYQAYCIPCHNQRAIEFTRARRAKIPKKQRETWFDKIEPEQQEKIKQQLADGMAISKIAKLNGFSYQKIYTWSKRNRPLA